MNMGDNLFASMGVKFVVVLGVPELLWINSFDEWFVEEDSTFSR